MQKLVLIAVAGAAGTLCRYGLAGVVQKMFDSSFAWGTVTVNLVGCLMFGLAWALAETRLNISGQVRALIFIGFFGAFTTFSTFVFETAQMLDESQWLWAAGNIVIQNIIGLVSLFAGLAIGRLI